jgi:LPS export ABC transporter protein LptC
MQLSLKIWPFLLMKLPVILGVSFLCSCETDIEKINSITAQGEYPEITAKKMEIIFSDSGRVKMQLFAESIRQFAKAERPYIDFPEGIEVKFYDDSLQLESEITANQAVYYTDERIWEARGNVIAVNLKKGETLNTEELIWDENSKLIYSNSFSRIETADGTFYGQNGFESNQQFSRWKLKGSRGTVNFKESDNAAENP